MRTVDALIQQAFDLHRGGDMEAAAKIYDKVLGFTDAQNLTALHHMAGIHARDGWYGTALALNMRVLHEAPEHVESWCNLGICLYRLGRQKAAEAAYKEGLRLNPQAEEILANYSGCLVNTGRSQDLIDIASDCVHFYPENAQGHQHLALGLLEQGRYAEAWPHYEWRWRLPENQKNRRPYKAPLWDGRKVGTLAIHGEQGLGDELLFMSCLRRASERADRIVVEAAKRLVGTFAASLPATFYPDHTSLIAAEGEPDAYIPMGSLPGICGLPSGEPYLPRSIRQGNGHPRIGIAWRGGTERTHKRARTVRLEQLAPILAVPGIEFVSVQYGDGGEVDEARICGLSATALGRDFEAAQQAIGSCDLIITVQQTAVHQAGAMGVPCWVLTPKATSWQFTPAHGDRMVWWDSVRLFRQGDDEKWEPVIDRIAQELRGQYALAA